MLIYSMDQETFDKLTRLQRQLHDRLNTMTFGEQRDFAETWRLTMREIVCEKIDDQPRG